MNTVYVEYKREQRRGWGGGGVVLSAARYIYPISTKIKGIDNLC